MTEHKRYRCSLGISYSDMEEILGLENGSITDVYTVNNEIKVIHKDTNMGAILQEEGKEYAKTKFKGAALKNSHDGQTYNPFTDSWSWV